MALVLSDLPSVDNNFAYTIIAVLGAIGAAWLTHRWDSKREKENCSGVPQYLCQRSKVHEERIDKGFNKSDIRFALHRGLCNGYRNRDTTRNSSFFVHDFFGKECK